MDPSQSGQCTKMYKGSTSVVMVHVCSPIIRGSIWTSTFRAVSTAQGPRALRTLNSQSLKLYRTASVLQPGTATFKVESDTIYIRK